MISALIFLIMLICTNYSMVGFICHGLHIYGPWLTKYSKVDLWLIRLLVSAKTASPRKKQAKQVLKVPNKTTVSIK